MKVFLAIVYTNVVIVAVYLESGISKILVVEAFDGDRGPLLARELNFLKVNSFVSVLR
jgi:hypothetical protein